MAITVKHSKVSTIPDDADTSLVRPSDWNDSHVVIGLGTSASLDAGVANGVATLDSSGTVPLSQIPALGDLNYQGTWNATTNSPTLTSSVGTKGFYYVVSVAGTTNLNGITDWQVGDWAVFNGSAWQKIDNTDAVTSVNGYTGTVVLNAADVGAVPYTGATGAVDLNAKTLVNVSNLGVNTNTVPTIRARVVGDNNSTSRIAMRGYSSDANSSSIRVSKFRGTVAAPQAPISGDSLGKFELAGYGTTSADAYPQVSLEGVTTEVWGATARGAKAVVKVTPNTTITQVTALTINQDSTAVFANTVTANGTLLTGNTGTVTSVSGTGTVSGISLSGTVTSSGNLTLGGTLDLSSPPAIGATTPAAGTFTTITGQTEVLNGTGQNLLQSSQLFNAGFWGANLLTINTTATTAPDSTSTGNSLIPTTSTGIHRVGGGAPVIAGTTYTASVYAKANGYNYLYMNCSSAIGATTTFNISTGTISTTGTGTATITSVGNGWYRCTVTGAPATTQTGTIYLQVNNTQTGVADDSYTGNGTSGIYLWGAQVNIGLSATNYAVTTSTITYGSPTLGFSLGASQIGLQNDGSLYVSPAGTGALQAQATTSTTVGGNARGANAVDWQTVRSSASQVASGSQVVIGGGQNNTATNQFSGVFSGYANTANNYQSVVVGGTSNTASQTLSAVVGGSNNTASGIYNFIGGGVSNTGTANAVVTTQATTAVTSGSTAVTLSATNANIKVGQLVTGTGIAASPAPYTYVAVISGTSLTLSQNASGTGTPTLNFYTPHGVVVGGGNNQATGAYSFIGGGGDAGTASNRNVASGDWSFVGGGIKNTASGLGSFVGGGGTNGSSVFPNTASNAGAVVVGGFSNSASGFGASVLGGNSNSANGAYSAVISGLGATNRSIAGALNFNASIASVAGDAQCGIYTLRKSTTDATPSIVTTDAGAAGTTNQVILPNNSAYYFKGEVVSGKTAGGDTKGWSIEGVIKRGANAASTALVGTPTVTSLYADAGATTWILAVTADTTNGGITVTFTGQAATTIRTVCRINTTEMTF